MKALRKERSLIPFCEIVIFEALRDETASFDTFMGSKIFWADKGDRYRIRVKKSDCVEVGDDVSLSWLVMKDQNAFAWNWE